MDSKYGSLLAVTAESCKTLKVDVKGRSKTLTSHDDFDSSAYNKYVSSTPMRITTLNERVTYERTSA